MEEKILRNISARIMQIDKDLGTQHIYENSRGYIGYFLELFVFDENDEECKYLRDFFNDMFKRGRREWFGNSVYVDYGIDSTVYFFDTVVLSALYQRSKKGEGYDSDWLISEKIIFYSLIFLTLYDKHYEKNLNIVCTMAKNFEFTPEEMEDYCLAVNTFINGQDIFKVTYKTDRGEKFFKIR